MTGLRAARINAGYRTAAEAHAAFAKGKKGREALSLSYWQKLEATGPALMHPPLMKRLSEFLGCSANLVFAWEAEPTRINPTTKGNATPTRHRRIAQSPGRERARQTKNRGASTPRPPKKVTPNNMTSLSQGDNS